MLESKSLSEIISKLLTFDKDLNLDDEEQFLEQRKLMIHNLIQKFKADGANNFEVKIYFMVRLVQIYNISFKICVKKLT